MQLNADDAKELLKIREAVHQQLPLDALLTMCEGSLYPG